MSHLVSIVMPSLNQAAFIAEAIESVLSQDYDNLELIVADGGSTDGSVELLTRLANNDARLKWFSEPDTGPADALNKALGKARGTLIGWLNSDDLYTPGAIGRVVSAFEANPGWVLLYGEGEHVDADGKPIERYPSLPPTDDALEDFHNGCFICQPTVFFKRTIKLLLGDLDVGLKTAFDFDYWLRAFKRFPGRIGFVDALQARSRLHDACITRTQRRQITLENMQVILRHLGDPQPHWLLSFAKERKQLAPDLEVEGLRGELFSILDEIRDQLSQPGFEVLKRSIERL